MTENEWETSRVPRPRPMGTSAAGTLRTHPLSEYVALEFPRESVAWVLRRGDDLAGTGERRPSRRGWSRAARPDLR